MRFKTLFFDLDDTVYPHTVGLWEEIRRRMDVYMYERLNLSREEIPKLRRYYLDTYGTTLRGLQNTMHIDAQDFLAYVHNIPIQQYLKSNKALRHILLSLPQRRWIFTNSDRSHAQRVLSTLGLLDCFEGIVDVNLLEFVPKPDPQAFIKVLSLAEARAETSVFFDDAVRNLDIAGKMGFTTVLVGPNSQLNQNGFDYHLQRLEELPDSLPWLWDNQV